MRPYRTLAAALFSATALSACAQSAPQPANTSHSPVSFNVYERARADVWQWFAAPPESETYSYGESLLRISVSQRIHRVDWLGEVTVPAIFDAPKDAVSPITAQGQLGLGGTYYAANSNDSNPVTASFKQGFLRYHFDHADKTNLRVGRFEFFDGTEIKARNPTMIWLQNNRVQQRIVGNFGFANAQRSFDGLDAHIGKGSGSGSWDITGFAARATQGVFNMNANPELNVDTQYLAFSQQTWKDRLQWRVFADGYHDGRTGVVKGDNRPLAIRQADHKNIRIGTYGADLYTVIPAGFANIDLLAWGAAQNGQWGPLSHSANAGAVEAGIQLTSVPTSPWFRGGFFHSSGDSNNADTKHETWFAVLPTPRVYARDPFYNQMNNQDEFFQLIDKPTKKLEIRSDLHWVQLTSGKDLWYQGGGAFDNKVFGFTGRPGNGHKSFDSMWDVSSDWQATKNLAVNLYYAHVWGKQVVAAIYPTDKNEQFGYAEFVYRWGIPQKAAK
jgi:hypothetical protein